MTNKMLTHNNRNRRDDNTRLERISLLLTHFLHAKYRETRTDKQSTLLFDWKFNGKSCVDESVHTSRSFDDLPQSSDTKCLEAQKNN